MVHHYPLCSNFDTHKGRTSSPLCIPCKKIVCPCPCTCPDPSWMEEKKLTFLKIVKFYSLPLHVPQWTLWLCCSWSRARRSSRGWHSANPVISTCTTLSGAQSSVQMQNNCDGQYKCHAWFEHFFRTDCNNTETRGKTLCNWNLILFSNKSKISSH